MKESFMKKWDETVGAALYERAAKEFSGERVPPPSNERQVAFVKQLSAQDFETMAFINLMMTETGRLLEAKKDEALLKLLGGVPSGRAN